MLSHNTYFAAIPLPPQNLQDKPRSLVSFEPTGASSLYQDFPHRKYPKGASTFNEPTTKWSMSDLDLHGS